MQRLAQETEQARRRGLIESVDDDVIRSMAKKDAIRRNDQEELDEDINEIEGMSKKLHKKHHHKSAKKSHHKDETAEDLDGDSEPAVASKLTSSSHLVKKAASLKDKMKKMDAASNDKKNHLHVKKNKNKKANASTLGDSSNSKDSSKATAEASAEDEDLEEPIAHEKDSSSKSKKSTDADALDDITEGSGSSHTQKSSSKSMASAQTPAMTKKDAKKEAVKAAHKKEFKHQMELTSHIGEQLQADPKSDVNAHT